MSAAALPAALLPLSLLLLLAPPVARGQSQASDPDLVPLPGSSLSRDDVLDSGAALRWGDINIVSITDVHSYISGHRHGDATVNAGWEPGYGIIPTAPQDADYADLLAFIEHMKASAAAQGRDLFVFNSGDVLDGTGISNLSPVNGEEVLPLVRAIPFDAVTIGNHELYRSSTVANMASSGFISHWREGQAFVTSNVLSADASALSDAAKTVGDPVGSRYTVLEGAFGRSVLVLGFLYNMDDHCDNVEVQHVEAALREPWFADAMAAAATVDAVIVLAHTDLKSLEVGSVKDAVRDALGPDKPLTFLAGHSHFRRFSVYDDRTAAIESGNYFNTLGWLSYDVPASPAAALDYDWRMIDANKATLAAAVDRPQAEFTTAAAARLRADIGAVRTEMGLDRAFGCNPHPNLLKDATVAMDDERSIWGLLMGTVIPTVLFTPPHNDGMWEVESTGGIRSTLFSGEFTVDDLFQMSPFGNTYFAIEGVPGATLSALYQHLLQTTLYRGNRPWDGTGLPPYACTDTDPDPERSYTLLVHSYDKDRHIGPALDIVDPGSAWMQRAVPYRQDGDDAITTSTMWSDYACRAEDWACDARSAAACQASKGEPGQGAGEGGVKPLPCASTEAGCGVEQRSGTVIALFVVGVLAVLGVGVATKMGVFAKFQEDSEKATTMLRPNAEGEKEASEEGPL